MTTILFWFAIVNINFSDIFRQNLNVGKDTTMVNVPCRQIFIGVERNS
jgi:hypothetical protein